MRLWSLEQVSRGVCVMELVETADIPTNFENNEMCIRDVTNLFCTYKVRALSVIQKTAVANRFFLSTEWFREQLRPN